jgi:hypothetical protein
MRGCGQARSMSAAMAETSQWSVGLMSQREYLPMDFD